MSHRPILYIVVPALALAAAASAQTPISVTNFRSIGPVNTSGRIDDIAVARIRGEPDAIYIATASGGVWKSSNNGVSFSPIFDRVNAMQSIGAIAVAPSAPTTVWVGTGEANTRQSSSWGDGVYKSTDAGKTWQLMGLRDTKSVARIVIDPNNADIVYVAAQGHLWGPNAERGVFKTTDGGRTWNKVLFVDENTGATDLVIDPANPQVLYAATYQRQRRTWGFNGGGPGSGIHKSTDGGATWTKLSNGLPKGEMGRIGLSIYASDPKVVYATVEAHAPDAGIYRTNDAGATWEKTSSLNTRPNYYSQIRIDPSNKDRVYTLGSNRGFYFSNDGGKAFTELFSNVHGEDHALWIDPVDGNHMVIGGDGGVSITWDRGRTWDFRRNMPLGQFYEIDVDNSIPFRVCGGLQDNGVWCVPSAVRNRNGIADRDAWNIGGGDGFHAHFDPTDDRMVIQSSQNGNVAWVNIETLERQGVRPGTGDRAANPPAATPGSAYRWNWDTPIVNSRHDPKTWYMGAQYLFKSTNRGSSWTKMSGDLTLSIDRDSLKMMGRTVARDALSRHDGQSNYGSLTAIGESPLSALVIYTGSDDGQVQVTRDGGKTWTNITKNLGAPDQTYVSAVLPSKYKAGRVYVTLDGHFTDDYKPYVFVSEDYGATFKPIVNGLPETSVNRIREHPTNPNLLVVAHARGVHYSMNNGASWQSLSAPVTNLPTVPVNDLVFQARDNALVLGTHGRGIWILDDVGSATYASSNEAKLLPIHNARLMATHSPQAWYGAGEFFAPNPRWDAVIQYELPSAASGQADITISDATGKVIRSLKGPAAAGVNRVAWDLRYTAPIEASNMPTPGGRGGAAAEEGAPAGGGRGGRGGPPPSVAVGFPAAGEGGGRGNVPLGPLAMPGRYNVRVTVPGGKTLNGSLVVEADPLLRMTAADRAARQAILMKIYESTKALGEARIAVRKLVAADSSNSKVRATAQSIDRALLAVNAARGPVEGWSGMPTLDQQRAVNNAIDDGKKAIAELAALSRR